MNIKKITKMSTPYRRPTMDSDSDENGDTNGFSNEFEENYIENIEWHRHKQGGAVGKVYPQIDENLKASVASTFNNYGKTPPKGTESPKIVHRKSTKENSDNESDEEIVPKPSSNNNESYTPYFIVVFVVIVGMIALFFVNVPTDPISDDTNNILKRSEELYDLDEFFPQQSPKVWATIVSGIKDLYINKPQQPCVILLLINEDEITGKSGGTGECLAQLVAEKVANDVDSSPAVVDAGTVKESEYGVALENLRLKASSQKALVINNLQDLSGSMAQSLHALCDRYNPAVKDALIMLTLRGHKRRENENVASFAQRILTKLWENDVPADKLPALVSRIVTSVVEVKPEKSLPSACA